MVRGGTVSNHILWHPDSDLSPPQERPAGSMLIVKPSATSYSPHGLNMPIIGTYPTCLGGLSFRMRVSSPSDQLGSLINRTGRR